MGDVAMLQVAISRLHQLLPNDSLYVISNSPELLKRYCPEAEFLSSAGRELLMQPWNILGKGRRIVPAKYYVRFSTLEQNLRTRYPKIIIPWITFRLQRYTSNVELLKDFWKKFKEADLVISTGGGYINDSFPRHARLVLQILEQAQAMGKLTALLGQGIGPLKGDRLRCLASSVLPNVDLIGLRENELSPKLLEEFKVPAERITITGDDAIELVFDNRTEGKGANVGVNIRLSSYSHVSQNQVEAIRTTLRQFCDQIGAGLQPVPISYNPDDSDIDSLYAHFDSLLPINEELKGATHPSPQAIIKAIGKCRIVVTGSYHAGVFALSQGVAVVGLSASSYYVAKFNGLKKQFEGGVEIVLLSGKNFKQRMLTSLQKAWDSSELLRNSLQKAALKQQAAGREFYGRVAELLDQQRECKHK